mmetsp:Transcript_31311/g.73012  ORF Transcript_31311/g.73012 Transcript_31311/m.73012 type:complete len:274 (-) Transcript_31311:96-917(-)
MTAAAVDSPGEQPMCRGSNPSSCQTGRHLRRRTGGKARHLFGVAACFIAAHTARFFHCQQALGFAAPARKGRKPVKAAKQEYITPTEARKEIQGLTLCLKSAVFGFPEFESLICLEENGEVDFYGGMIAREPGNWCVEPGAAVGEDAKACYLLFQQPLTDRYSKIFDVPSGKVLWKGRLNIDDKQISVKDGFIVSETTDGKDLQREGTFEARLVNEVQAKEIRKKNKEAFERALTTPKGESTGFKTFAKIAQEGTRLALKPGSKGRGLDDLND